MPRTNRKRWADWRPDPEWPPATLALDWEHAADLAAMYGGAGFAC